MLLTLAMLLLVGCNSDEPQRPPQEPGQAPREPVTIRLGWGTPGQEAFYVMQHMPEVAANLGTWYEVEWAQLNAPQFAQSIASGAVDGGVIGVLAAANAIEQGAELVFTGQFIEERAPNRPMTWLVRADSGINSPADLAGRTVATIGPGTGLDYVQDYYLETAGLAPGEYEEVQVQFPQMMDALLSGQVALGAFPPPFLQQALASGEVRPIGTILDVQPVSVATLMGFQRDFVEDNRETVEKFVEDWVAVHRWINDPANREQVIQATSEATQVPVQVLERYLLTEEDGYRSPTGAINIDAVQANWDFFRGRGAFESDLRFEDYLIEDLLPPAS